MYCGIDNGINGGIVITDFYGEIIAKIATPALQTPQTASKKSRRDYDIEGIKDFFKAYRANLEVVFLETPQYISLGIHAISSTWKGYGIYCGMLTALGIEYESVGPQTWQRKIIADCEGEDTKAKALSYAKKHRPEESWLATPRSRVPHDGMVDAFCIAEFGRKYLR